MVALLRLVAGGVFIVAVLLHVVGYATDYWVSASLDSRGIKDVLDTNGMASSGMGLEFDSGMEISLGLWKYCMTFMTMSKCEKAPAEDTPDWMKGTQALGILTMIVAAVAIVFTVYDILGQGKGDRARLLPVFIAVLYLVSGLLLVIAVAVYGAKFMEMMNDQLSMMGTNNPVFAPLAANVKQHTNLGWSFALEAVAAVMMIIASALSAVPIVRGLDGSPQNRAV